MSTNRKDSADASRTSDNASEGTKSHRRTSSESSVSSGRNSEDKPPSRPSLISPLKQVNAEHSPHQPKVISVYNKLFTEIPHTPGYWVEFFLLPVNKTELLKVLAADPRHFLYEPGLTVVHTLVRAAVANLSSDLPADIVINALQVLSIVVTQTLDLSASTAPDIRKQADGSSAGQATSKGVIPGNFSVIAALTGLEHASAVLDDLSSRVLTLLYSKNRHLVGEAAIFVLNIARKIWGTQIASLFSRKNYFAAFITIIDVKIDDAVAVDALNCIGILTGLNAYGEDSASIYRQRINDYVDEAVMMKILALAQRELTALSTGTSSSTVSVANHQLTGNNSNGILTWVSGWFSEPPPAKTTTDETNRLAATEAYSSEHIILPLFLFTVHNSVFASQFAASPALIALLETCISKRQFSISSSPGSSLQLSHTWLALLMMRSLVENEFLSLSDPSSQAIIKLHSSKLALDTSRRLPLAGILDFTVLILKTGCASAKRENTTADFRLLHQAAELIYQICAQMVATRTMWVYNWTQLWKTILSSITILTASSAPKVSNDKILIIESLVSLLLVILVGMALRRDMLEEEDWHALLFSTIYNSATLGQVSAKFPNLAQSPALLAARAMTAQYELSKEKPDFIVIQKQGTLAAGPPLISDKLRPFSISGDSVVKWAIKEQIV